MNTDITYNQQHGLKDTMQWVMSIQTILMKFKHNLKKRIGEIIRNTQNNLEKPNRVRIFTYK